MNGRVFCNHHTWRVGWWIVRSRIYQMTAAVNAPANPILPILKSSKS